jgi:hypothetical protein
MVGYLLACRRTILETTITHTINTIKAAATAMIKVGSISFSFLIDDDHSY